MSKQQRTKGNKKPASSGRAAALLSSDGVAVSSTIGFIGFDALSVPDTDAKSTDLSQDLDPHVRTAMRKLLKKDNVTKLKGLKEIQDFLESDDFSDDNAGSLILCWSRLYSKLALDGHFKVRDASHRLTIAICKRFGRKTEKHIVELVPAWFLGQHDPYSEVATTAKTGLNECFKDKLDTAIALCSEPLIQMCCDLITGSTNLCALPKLAQPTEQDETAEMRINRLLVTSLLSVRSLLETMRNTQQLDALLKKLDALLWSDNKFWKKISKHQQRTVRAAYFHSLVVWIQCGGDVLAAHLPQVSASIIASLDEKDVSVCKSVWDALLCLLATHDTIFWSQISIEKAFMPKVLSLVHSNSAVFSTMQPAFLPVFESLSRFVNDQQLDTVFRKLLSSFVFREPVSSVSDQFGNAFSDCFKLSLHNDRIRASLSLEFLNETLVSFTIQSIELGSEPCVSSVARLLCWFYQQDSVTDVENATLNQRLRDLLLDGRHYKMLQQFLICSYANWPDSSPPVDVLSSFLGALLDLCGSEQKLSNCVMLDALLDRCSAALELNTWKSCPNEKYTTVSALLEYFAQLLQICPVESGPSLVSCWLRFGRTHLGPEELYSALNHVISNQSSSKKKLLFLRTAPLRLELETLGGWCKTEQFEQFWLSAFDQVTQSDALMELVPAYNCGVLCAGLLEKTLISIESGLVFDGQQLSSVRAIVLLAQLVEQIFNTANNLSCTPAGHEVTAQLWTILLDHGRSVPDLLSLRSAVKLSLKQQSSYDLWKRMCDAVTNRIVHKDSLWLADLALEMCPTNDTSIFIPLLPAEIDLGVLVKFVRLPLLRGDICVLDVEPAEGGGTESEFFNVSCYCAKIITHCGTEALHKHSIAYGIFGAGVLENYLKSNGLQHTVQISDQQSLALSSFVQYSISNWTNEQKEALLCEFICSFGGQPQLVYVTQWILNFLAKRLTLSTTLASSIISNDNINILHRVAYIGALELIEPKVLYTIQNQAEIDAIWNARWILARNDNYFGSDLLSPWLGDDKKLQDVLLFCCSISDETDWKTLAFNVNFVCYLYTHCANQIEQLASEQRDYVCCSLITWLQTCAESAPLASFGQYLFCSAVYRLFCCLSKNFERIELADPTRELVAEWKDFFVDACAAVILPDYLDLCKETDSIRGDAVRGLMLELVCSSVSYLNVDSLLKVQLPTLLDPEMDSKQYPAQLQTIILCVQDGLLSNEKCIQVASYSILKKLIASVLESETGLKTADAEQELRDFAKLEQFRAPPAFLLSSARICYNWIETALVEHKLQVLESNKSALFGFLLSWHLLLDFYALLSLEDRPEFIRFLRQESLVQQMLLTLFCVMPQDVAVQDTNNNCFKNQPTFLPNGAVQLSEIESLACSVYYNSLRLFPAVVRQWYNSLDKAAAANVDRFTRKHVTSLLSTEQLQALANKGKQIHNLTVTVRPVVGEVVAKYKTEDCTMELLVTLPPNYPLQQARVDAKQAAVNVELGRRWLLQLTVFFAHQNGSLLDGLLMWKRNIDKHLEGVEDCMICMMTVHSVNGQLPKVTCRQCKKKFHGACLYKWFSTSSNSSCPLCRCEF